MKLEIKYNLNIFSNDGEEYEFLGVSNKVVKNKLVKYLTSVPLFNPRYKIRTVTNTEYITGKLEIDLNEHIVLTALIVKPVYNRYKLDIDLVKYRDIQPSILLLKLLEEYAKQLIEEEIPTPPDHIFLEYWSQLCIKFNN